MIPISLHEAQREIFMHPARFRTTVNGRRFGKTRLIQWEIVRAALSFPGTIDRQSPQVVLGALPTLQQAKGILWRPLAALFEGTALSKYAYKINHSDHTIYLRDGKPPIVIRGANDQNGDRMRGNRIWFLAADEYQDWKPDIFSTVCRPAMADTLGSRGIFTGTPKGKLNHLYKMYLRAEQFPQIYASWNKPTSSNVTIPNLEEELEEARRTLPPRLFRQEYEASFEDFEGKIFSELDEDNRVTLLSRTGMPDGINVLGIDWGDVNPALVVLNRDPSGLWSYLEGWQGNFSLESQGGSPVTTPMLHREIVRLAQKYNIVNTFCDPSRPASILEVRALGADHNQPGLKRAIGGNNAIQDGIDYVHSLIYQKRLLFPAVDAISPYNRKLSQWHVTPDEAVQLFAAYHRKKNKDGIITEDVADGQNDHIIDATRYALMPIIQNYFSEYA